VRLAKTQAPNQMRGLEAFYAFSACMMTNVRAIAVRRGDERATGETQFVLFTAKSSSTNMLPSATLDKGDTWL